MSRTQEKKKKKKKSSKSTPPTISWKRRSVACAVYFFVFYTNNPVAFGTILDSIYRRHCVHHAFQITGFLLLYFSEDSRKRQKKKVLRVWYFFWLCGCAITLLLPLPLLLSLPPSPAVRFLPTALSVAYRLFALSPCCFSRKSVIIIACIISTSLRSFQNWKRAKLHIASTEHSK